MKKGKIEIEQYGKEDTKKECECRGSRKEEDMIHTQFGCYAKSDHSAVLDNKPLTELIKKTCKYCGTDYEDPVYCSVFGRTADKHVFEEPV